MMTIIVVMMVMAIWTTVTSYHAFSIVDLSINDKNMLSAYLFCLSLASDLLCLLQMLP